MSVKVGINGYGTIGKRIASAILKTPGLELVGVVKRSPDYSAFQAINLGIKVYAPDDSAAGKFRELGLEVAGTLTELLEKVDLIVDATPGGVGAKYKPVYEKANVKAIYQGGEKSDVAEVSFSSLCNYEDALDKTSVRVVSCNTTGLLRTICTLNSAFGVEKVRATIVRRAADPKEIKRGPVNSIVLNPPKLPSHHALDVKSVLPWLDIWTSALVVPTTLMHVHSLLITLKGEASREEVLEVLRSAPRIMLVSSERSGIKSTAQLVEAAREVRHRYDIPELVVFEDSVYIEGRELVLFQAVHQESIVVPENIDAIKAMSGLETDGNKAIKDTDEVLGLTKSLW
ncbi:MAG: type II glyceraldehyde-3-phosphate dehydrogenase [Desulfurococcales archaeon]|nr:type II glyceraldehyde-3-phosphate dehydrogenase [Desulfurococcales archaeon]